MNKKKPRNVPQGMRPPTYEELLEGVRLDELKARHWKAQWETAYYHLEFEKILPEYQALLKLKEEENRKKIEEQLEQLKKIQEEKEQSGAVPEQPDVEEELVSDIQQPEYFKGANEDGSQGGT